MQVLTLIWGILAICGMIVAFFPCLGSLNWLNIPFSIIGLVIGVVALSTSRDPNKGAAVTGTVLCGIAALLGALRLIVGAGVL